MSKFRHAIVVAKEVATRIVVPDIGRMSREFAAQVIQRPEIAAAIAGRVAQFLLSDDPCDEAHDWFIGGLGEGTLYSAAKPELDKLVDYIAHTLRTRANCRA